MCTGGLLASRRRGTRRGGITRGSCASSGGTRSGGGGGGSRSRHDGKARRVVTKELADDGARRSAEIGRKRRDRNHLEGAGEALRALDARLHGGGDVVADLDVLIYDTLEVLVAGVLGGLADRVLLLSALECGLLARGRAGLARSDRLAAIVDLCTQLAKSGSGI
jgi:hypothetical protein